MGKLYLRDIGSHPERDLEITLFKDGELQFEADNGKYVHINIARAGVSELIKFLQEETQPTPRALDGALCACPQPRFSVGNPSLCIICGKSRRQ